MFKNLHWSRYLAFSITAAVLYSIPIFFFLEDASYSQAWLLYLGNALFMVSIAVFLFTFNGRRDKNASSLSMLKAANITSIVGIIIACVLCFILLSIMVPGLFRPGTPEKVLTGAPANTLQDKTKGLLFMIYGSAIIGNVAAGLFVSIIFPFALKGDQTKEKVPPKQSAL